MNVKNAEKKEKSTVELVIEVASEEWERALNAAYRKNRGSISVPGFRKGKAPRKIIEGMYGSSVFYEDAISEAYPEALEKAVAQEKLNVVGKPTLDIVEVTKDGFTFKALLGVYPEVTLGAYKELSAEYAEPAVTEADVDEEVIKLQKRNARLESVEREVKSGDTAVIDFEGFVDGVAFEGGKGESYSLEIGSGSFIPGFEDQIVGMKPGEEKNIDVTFPENYAESLAGKAAVFKIKLHELKENILPEPDDEFAKDVSEFDTMAEFRESLRKKLLEERTGAAEDAFENAVIQQALDNMEAELPDAMIEEQVDSMIDNYSMQLSSQGVDLEQYLKYSGGSLEDLRKSARPNAESRIRYELAMNKIAEAEGFEFTEEEKEEELRQLAESYGVELDMVKKTYPADYVLGNLKLSKARKLVVDSGVKTAGTTGEAGTSE